MDKLEKAAARVDRTKKAAMGEVKLDDMTGVLIAMNVVPRAAITLHSSGFHDAIVGRQSNFQA